MSSFYVCDFSFPASTLTVGVEESFKGTFYCQMWFAAGSKPTEQLSYFPYLSVGLPFMAFHHINDVYH